MAVASTASTSGADCSGPVSIPDITNWVEDMKLWPPVQEHQIIYYLLKSKACDLEQVNAIKSTEAYNYVESGKVGCLLVHKDISQDCVFIKGEVQRSQAVNLPAHKAWVCLTSNGTVITADCTCMAGAARVCSHVGIMRPNCIANAGALLWKVEFAVRLGLTGAACTDQSAEWNRGTKKNVLPGVVKEMDFKLHKGMAPKKGVHKEVCPKLNKFKDHSAFTQHFQSPPPFKDLASVEGTLLHLTLNPPHCQPAAEPPAPETPASVCPPTHGTHSSAGPESCLWCQTFYQKYVAITDEAQLRLAKGTVEQRGNVWQGSRRVRMTASETSKVPKRKQTNPEKAVARLLKDTFYGNKATEHGKQCEPLARKAFELETGKKVLRIGTVVSQSHPFLSASPDGLVGNDSILEIKCPYVEDCSALLDSGKYDVKKGGEGYQVCKTGRAGYYSQVQFTMYCCQRQHCYLYVWTKKKTLLVEVKYDPEFIESNLTRIRSFYFCSYLPALVDDSETLNSAALEDYLMFLGNAKN